MSYGIIKYPANELVVKPFVHQLSVQNDALKRIRTPLPVHPDAGLSYGNADPHCELQKNVYTAACGSAKEMPDRSAGIARNKKSREHLCARVENREEERAREIKRAWNLTLASFPSSRRAALPSAPALCLASLPGPSGFSMLCRFPELAAPKPLFPPLTGAGALFLRSLLAFTRPRVTQRNMRGNFSCCVAYY